MSKKNNNQAVVPTKKQNLIQALKFTLFSISAGIIQIISYTLLLEVFKLDEWICHLTALILSVLWNFTFNRRYTFKSAANLPVAMLKVALFYVIFTPLSTWGIAALSSLEIGKSIPAYSILIEAGMMIVNFITEFLYCRFVVYRGNMYTNDLGQKEMEELAQSEETNTETVAEEVIAEEAVNEEA